jgi:hypothetical protein
MATLMPWTTVDVGDLEIFAPAVPCLVVNTWYMDGEPDSTVIYFWQDEATGLINHELVYVGPVSFEVALAWAQEHAPTRGVERIHVKHGLAERKRVRSAAKTKRGKKAAAPVKGRMGAKAKKAKKHGRKSSAR